MKKNEIEDVNSPLVDIFNLIENIEKMHIAK
jgi:hypothetical protein